MYYCIGCKYNHYLCSAVVCCLTAVHTQPEGTICNMAEKPLRRRETVQIERSSIFMTLTAKANEIEIIRMILL